jgi:hypothetical protein
MKVLTIEGIEKADVPNRYQQCNRVTAYAPSLDREVVVCAEDLKSPLPQDQMVPVSKRGRGRPKGTTVKRGAKKPRVNPCAHAEMKVTKGGRRVCQCNDGNNRQILSPKEKVCQRS